jgi:hypothetical protein
MTQHQRVVWGTFAVLFGLLFGTATGVLSYLGDVPVPLSIIAGGGAFGATVAFFLALVRYLTEH